MPSVRSSVSSGPELKFPRVQFLSVQCVVKTRQFCVGCYNPQVVLRWGNPCTVVLQFARLDQRRRRWRHKFHGRAADGWMDDDFCCPTLKTHTPIHPQAFHCSLAPMTELGHQNLSLLKEKLQLFEIYTRCYFVRFISSKLFNIFIFTLSMITIFKRNI